jgi:hypothetical protein
MRKIITITGISAVACVAATVAVLSFANASGAETTGLISDHALIDQTSGDTSVFCRATNKQAFTVYGAFRAIDGNVTMRVTFKDGDFVDYPIAQDTSFSLSEAAGGTPSVDKKIVVSTSGGTGSLVGWMSAARSPGSKAFVECGTT